MKKYLIILFFAQGTRSAFGQNSWTQKADFGGSSRYYAAGFSVGAKGYIGAGSYNNYDLWEYNTGADSWNQKSNILGSGMPDGCVGLSINGKGYIGTGSTPSATNGSKVFLEFNPATNAWTQKANLPGADRDFAVGFSIGAKGYLGTGHSLQFVAGNYVHYFYQDFWEYDPNNNSWTQKADFAGTGRSGAVGFSIGDRGYIGTGRDGSNKLMDFWEYNPNSDAWTQKADFAGGIREGAFGFSLDIDNDSITDKGYIGAGDNGSMLQDFWEYDPVKNTWIARKDFGNGNPVARSNAAAFSIGGKGYVGTGWNGSNSFKDFWEYTPCGVGSATIVVSGNTTFCQGDSIELTAGAGSSYLWSNGANTQSISINTTGNYTVTVTDINGCMATAQPIAVIVSSNPVKPTISQSGNILICNTNLSKANYQWYFGSIITGATFQTYIPTQNGMYLVQITDTSTGCTRMSEPFNVTSVVGIKEAGKNPSIKIYPNPSVGNFTIVIDDPLEKEIQVKVLNFLGEEVFITKKEKTNGIYSKEIILQNATKGIYLVKAIVGEKIKHSKLTIE